MLTPLEVICYAVGAIVGSIYVFQEYRTKITSEKIDQYPRLKNLVYLVGTSTIGFIVDWNGLAKVVGQKTEINRFEVWLHYALATSVTILVLLLITSVWVAIDAMKRNERVREQEQVAPLWAIGMFLRGGYLAYREKVDELEERRRREVEAGAPILQVCHTINLALSAVENFRESGANQHAFASGILDLIATAVRAQLPELKDHSVIANYMKAVSKETATPEQLETVHFEVSPYRDCKEILILEQSGGSKVPPKFALPIHRDEEKLLPGAPMAYAKNSIVAVVSVRPSFQRQVSSAVRQQVKAYFKTVSYKSLLCVPMQKGRKIVGVVCIEADTDTFDMRDPRIGDVGLSLHPLCLSLAYLSD